MNMNTAIEANVLFEIRSYIKSKSIKRIKEAFVSLNLVPQQVEINRLTSTRDLDDVIRLQTEELQNQELSEILRDMKRKRELMTQSSVSVTWSIYSHLAKSTPDHVFAEYLIRGLPLFIEDATSRRMHSVMRYVFFTLFKILAQSNQDNLSIDNFILMDGDVHFYEYASNLIKNQKYKNQQKKSKNLQKTLLGDSGIKNVKNLQNLKKNNIFFLYDCVDLELASKDKLFVNMLLRLMSYNNINKSINEAVGNFMALKSVIAKARILERQGMLDSAHRMSADINVNMPELEINGLASMIGFGSKPFIKASYPGNNLNSTVEKEIPKSFDTDSCKDSYHTAGFHVPTMLENLYSWFTNFNADHVMLLSFAVQFISTKMLQNGNSVLRKAVITFLSAVNLYFLYLHGRKILNLFTEMPNLSDDTCNYFFNSFCLKTWIKIYNWILHKWTGQSQRPIVVSEDWEIHMDPVPEPGCVIEELEPQGFTDTSSVMKLISTGILSYFAASVKLKSTPGAADLFMAFLNSRDYAANNFLGLLTTCGNLIQDCFNLFFKSEVDFMKYFDTSKYASEEAKVYCKNISDKLVSYSTGAEEINTFSNVIFMEDMAEGIKLLKKLDRGSYDYQRVTTLLREYEKLSVQNKIALKALSGSRVEPVGLLLKGPPGVMKTIALNRIARMVTKFTIPSGWKREWDENPDAFVYNIPNDKFWDGYTYKAWVAIADDLFQLRDAAGDQDSDALKVIKMINCNPYVLQMADVSSKNTKFFRSAFVAATTNLTDFAHLESIRDYKAVSRRFHLTLNVSVNPKYKDDEKYKDVLITDSHVEFKANKIPYDYWVFKDSTGKVLLMDEVVVILAKLHRKHVADHLSNIKSTQECIDDLEEAIGSRFNIYGEVFMESMSNEQKIPSDIDYCTFRANQEDLDKEGSGILSRQSGFFSQDKYAKDYIFCSSQRKNISLSDVRLGKYSGFKLESEYFKSSSTVDIMTAALKVKRDLVSDKLGNALSSMKSEVIVSFLKKVGMHIKDVSDFSIFDGVGLHLEDLDKVIYIEDGKLEIDFDIIVLRFLQVFLLGNEEDWEEEELSVSEIMSLALSKFKSCMSQFITFVKDNIGTLLMISLVGVGVLKLLQAVLRIFMPGEEILEVDLDKIDRQSDSPDRAYAKGKKKERPKHIKKGDILRKNDDRVNWDGKMDSRRGMRLKKAHRKGLALDGFDTRILGKVDVSDVDVINHSDIVTKILNKYYFILYVRDTRDDSLKKVGQVVNLVGNIYLMPHHFIDSIDNYTLDHDKDFEIILTTVNKRLIYRFPIQEFLDSGYATPDSLDKDLVYMVLSHAQINSAGIMKYIADNSEYDRISSMKLIPTCLVGVSLSESGNTITCKKMDATMDTSSYYVKSNSEEEPGYVITNTISYNSSSSRGDCGSLLVNEKRTATGKCLIGIHIAGYSEKGVSATLNYDDICKDFKACGIDGHYLYSDELENLGVHHPISVESQSGVHLTATLPDTMAAAVPFKTDLQRSKFFGALPAPFDKPDTRPARLKPFFDSDGRYIDPYQNGLLNYGKDQVCVSSSVCSAAACDYRETIFVGTANYAYDRIQPISLREALHNFRGVGPIMSSTSAGWPLSLDKNNMKKRYYSPTSTVAEKEQAFTEIESEINHILDQYSNGVRPAFIYTDCLKDEKVSIEKCHLGKTRIFSACPFSLLVLFRMYYGAFMDAFIQSNFDVGSAIGVNPYSEQWGYLVHKLKVHGSSSDGVINVGAGDFSKFDGHEQPYLLNMVYRIISDWYGYKNIHACTVRKYLWAEITNSRHIHGNNVYEWFASMPSGNPLTSLINTMYNNLVFRAAWIIAGNHIGDFHNNVYIAAMGDDNIFSVSEKYRDSFNEIVMPDLMKQVGMVYTTELKKTASFAFRPIQEVEFLKRSFKYDGFKNRWVAPLRFSAIIEILNWTKKGNKGDEIAVDNAGLVLREISLHGKTLYDEWFSIISELLKEKYKSAIPKGIFTSNHLDVYNSVLDTKDFQY